MNRELDSQKQPIKRRQQLTVRKAPQYTENPFMKPLSTEIRGKKKFYNVISKNDLIVTTEGEIRQGMGVEHKVVKIADDAEFVKVFRDGVSGIYDLNTPGKKVFGYLLDVVQANPNTDRIYLFFMDAMEEPWSISKPVFFRGLAELLLKNFIARSYAPNMFYLNPAMIWNGDRFRFVQEYIRKSSKMPETEATEAPKLKDS
jgi:hypothetical protein